MYINLGLSLWILLCHWPWYAPLALMHYWREYSETLSSPFVSGNRRATEAPPIHEPSWENEMRGDVYLLQIQIAVGRRFPMSPSCHSLPFLTGSNLWLLPQTSLPSGLDLATGRHWLRLARKREIKSGHFLPSPTSSTFQASRSTQQHHFWVENPLFLPLHLEACGCWLSPPQTLPNLGS